MCPLKGFAGYIDLSLALRRTPAGESSNHNLGSTRSYTNGYTGLASFAINRLRA
ncbi:hypothetical protein BD310DRAFT_197664 [Dichomitus squalens]|uniref:Uncharacterized protein n=1 Tax=Dichomitus squalens TaxID=114155 RepID=A0A4Q9Q2Y4_9APHY|nr:hypothetical protein BD310DRAFT_197664 [Dichomitus squalens]